MSYNSVCFMIERLKDDRVDIHKRMVELSRVAERYKGVLNYQDTLIKDLEEQCEDNDSCCKEEVEKESDHVDEVAVARELSLTSDSDT